MPKFVEVHKENWPGLNVWLNVDRIFAIVALSDKPIEELKKEFEEAGERYRGRTEIYIGNKINMDGEPEADEMFLVDETAREIIRMIND
jgi:hypothetical protein